jgi:virginiamycin B lyase
MKNNTSNGIAKIPIPMNSFKGIDPKQVSTGSIAVDTKRNVIWISAFASEGDILRSLDVHWNFRYLCFA